MVQLILGRAGVGKSTLLLQNLEEWLVSGRQGILLVPEQASFFNEERLTRRLGLQVAKRAQIVSFTRLARQIFREYGGLRGVHLDAAAKIALMSIVLEELSPNLEMFRKSVTQSAFVGEMCKLIGELQSAGVTGEELQGLAQSGKDLGERQKLRELALVLEGYRAMCERGYLDPEEELYRACNRVEGTSYFTGKAVFADGFVSFSNGEWRLLEQVCRQDAQLTVSLCCPKWEEREVPSVFSIAQHTGRRLMALARRCGAAVKTPVVLTEERRYETAGLRHFIRQYGEASPAAGSSGDGVFGYCCKDAFTETETVARQIAQLVREGYRYRDIVVTARQMEQYEAAMAVTFPLYGIPYFYKDKGSPSSFVLLRGVTAALKAVESGYRTEQVLLLAKSGLTVVSGVDAARLENYAYLWRIEGKAWTQSFQGHPKGLLERKETPRQAALAKIELERLNALRQQVMEPLTTLEHRLSGCDGKGFAAAIYLYLQDIGARTRLLSLCSAVEESEGKGYLDYASQIWDAFMQVLDVFGGPLGTYRYSLDRFVGLLTLCLEQMRVSLSPQTQDQVLVGQADVLRPNEVKVLFALGLTQDGFPAAPAKSGGLLTEAQRDRLTRDGYPLLITAQQRHLQEQFYAYFLLAQPRERLYLSYPRQSLMGEAFTPSMVMVQGEQVFGRQFVQWEQALPELWSVVNVESAYQQMCRSWREDTPLALALRRYFQREKPELMELLSRIGDKRPFSLDTSEGQALFAGDMALSPSRLEQYYGCPFSYFCRYALELRPRRQVEISVLETGRLLHGVLEEMLRRYPGKALSAVGRDELRRQSSEILRQQVRQAAGDVAALSARDRYLFARQANTAAAVLERLAAEFAQSAYQPVAVELAVGEGTGKCPGWRFTLVTGDAVTLQGVVDRVDVFEQTDKRYIRVIDYKTGTRKLRLDEVYGGLNTQMLFYLFILRANYHRGLDNLSPIDSAPGETVEGESLSGENVDPKTADRENAAAEISASDTADTKTASPQTVDKNQKELQAYHKENLPGGVLYMPSRLTFVPGQRGEAAEHLRRRREAEMRMNGLLLDDVTSLRAMEAELAGRFIPVREKQDGSMSKSGERPVSLAVMADLEGTLRHQVEAMALGLKAGAIPALPVRKAGDGAESCSVCAYCDYKALCLREVSDPLRELPSLGDIPVLQEETSQSPPEKPKKGRKTRTPK